MTAVSPLSKPISCSLPVPAKSVSGSSNDPLPSRSSAVVQFRTLASPPPVVADPEARLISTAMSVAEIEISEGRPTIVAAPRDEVIATYWRVSVEPAA